MENQIRFFKTENVLCIAKDEGFLGAGLTGTVRCGFHEFHGTIAAKCSVMQGKMKKRNALEKRIKEEIGLLQTFNHENIVRVYGWTQWPGAIAIIMEHLPGGNLMEVLTDEDVVLEPALRLRMSYEAANGIAFIHNLSSDRRITHGDIKPENILLTEDLHCKIADFGSARLSAYTGGTTTTMTSNRQQNVQFTELYAAPEVVKDPSIKPKPPRDTYSFGVTLYMMLGREIPIPAEYMLMYLESVKKGERPSLETINDVIRQLEEEERASDVTIIVTLKQIMEECWHQDPTLRPLMVDVKNGLHELLAKQDLVKIQQHVVDATIDLEIQKLSRGQCLCVPLDQFLPPEFQCIADHSSLSDASSNAITSASLNSSYREDADASNTNITPHQPNENSHFPTFNSTELKSLRKMAVSSESLYIAPDQNEADCISPPTYRRSGSRIECMIGKNGRRIVFVEYNNCYVEFPTGALENDVVFNLSISNQTDSEKSDDFILTPTMECLPSMTFRKPVTISLPTCYVPVNAYVLVLPQTRSGTKWIDSDPIPHGGKDFICFTTSTFSDKQVRADDKQESQYKTKTLQYICYQNPNLKIPCLVWRLQDNIKNIDEMLQQGDGFKGIFHIEKSVTLTMEIKGKTFELTVDPESCNVDLKFKQECFWEDNFLISSETNHSVIMLCYYIKDNKINIKSGNFPLPSLKKDASTLTTQIKDCTIYGSNISNKEVQISQIEATETTTKDDA